MSFPKRKKKQNSSIFVATPIADEILNGVHLFCPSNESDSAENRKELTENNDLNLNGVYKILNCDNNNKNIDTDEKNGIDIINDDNELISSIPAATNTTTMTTIPDLNINITNNDHLIESQQQQQQQQQLNNNVAAANKFSSAKRKFLILTRLFKPWKWKRKRSTNEKSIKGNLGKIYILQTKIIS